MSNGDAHFLSICKRQKVALGEQIDWISNLPDSILAHILSLLPIEDAVKTVMIRRFGNLWTSIHNLDLDLCMYHECWDFPPRYRHDPVDEERLINLIHHVLIRHERSDIHRFRLKLDINSRFKLANEIDSWICFAMRKKVNILDLDFKACSYACRWGYHKLPNVVLTGDTLTELKLVHCHVEPLEHIQLQSLKSLSLKDVLISDKTMIEILSACPVLESLFIDECDGFHKLNLTSLNLKNVVIELNKQDSSRLKVSCPYVTSLNISGIERMDLNNLSSVVDAALDFTSSFNCGCGE